MFTSVYNLILVSFGPSVIQFLCQQVLVMYIWCNDVRSDSVKMAFLPVMLSGKWDWNPKILPVNTLRLRQNGRHFADVTFKRIFLNENIGISIKISLKFVPKGPINNIPALVQVMAWRRPGHKPLTEPMVVRSLMHICVTQPQWLNSLSPWRYGCNFKLCFSNPCQRLIYVWSNSIETALMWM